MGRSALGEKFPKLPFHKIACIGALIAERRDAIIYSDLPARAARGCSAMPGSRGFIIEWCSV